MSHDAKASSNFIWPPTIYVLAALALLALTWYWPWPLLDEAAEGVRWGARSLGAAAVLCGGGIALAAEQSFERAGTPTPPTRPTTALATDGVFRYTRNPMYLGMTAMLAGLGLLLLSAWLLVLVPAAMFAVFKLAIEREERYLAAKFGDVYDRYRGRVRRWL